MRTLQLAAASLVFAAAANAATLHETIDRTFDVKPGATVAVSNVNGRIAVSSWDQPKVRVIAYKEAQGDREDAQEALKELRVEMQQRNGGVTVITHHPRRHDGVSSIFSWLLGDHVDMNVRYEVTVPRTMNLDVRNTNGSIHLTGINGRHEVGTTNGRIELAACAGSVDASTTNGAIRAQLTRVSKGESLRFETTNGRIEVEVPKDLAANVDADTTNGSISTDLPITATRTDRNSLRGTINGGGTELRLRTTNGGIAIRVKS